MPHLRAKVKNPPILSNPSIKISKTQSKTIRFLVNPRNSEKYPRSKIVGKRIIILLVFN